MVACLLRVASRLLVLVWLYSVAFDLWFINLLVGGGLVFVWVWLVCFCCLACYWFWWLFGCGCLIVVWIGVWRLVW